MINLYFYAPRVKSLGPGTRFGLWVQGCYRRCKGCIAPDSWDPKKGKLISIDRLVSLIEEANVDGITISGGEPFLQSRPLSRLIDRLTKTLPELDYILYTGYKIEDIMEDGEKRELLNRVDLVIDGEYIEELNQETPLRGSINQRIVVLSERGQKLALHFLIKQEREVEFLIKDGEIRLVGIPPKKLLNLKSFKTNWKKESV